MKIAVYPGSFDPVTNGHLDIIERAGTVFDKVIVAVLKNSDKNPLFSMKERAGILKEVLVPYSFAEVDCYTGLTVEYVEEKGAIAIIRGLRAISDFENELQMALTNKKLKPSIETVFLMANAEYSFLSSSIVKEIARWGGCIDGLVPPLVIEKIKEKNNIK